jgi:hypothetical protein
MSTGSRKAYPSDVSGDERALVAPCLTLLPEDAGQQRYPVREVFNGRRWMVRARPLALAAERFAALGDGASD